MTPDQIVGGFPRPEEFAAKAFVDLARVDQKDKRTL
jgi:hypothetical protein